MREIRLSGSEGGGAVIRSPYPYILSGGSNGHARNIIEESRRPRTNSARSYLRAEPISLYRKQSVV
jgi:hypothetical protein